MSEDKTVLNEQERENQLFNRFARKFERGQVIFSEGDRGEEMFIIHSGKVKISKRIGDVQKTLAILDKGEFFGEMSILNNKPRSATVEVIEEGHLLVIDRKTFETMIRNNVEIALRMIKKMANRLQQSDDQIEILLIRDEMQRVVYYIKQLIQDHGIETRDWLRIDYNYSPIEFAGMVGISLSSVNKIMDRLVKGGFINFKDGKIVITQKKRFQDLLKYIDLRDRFSDFIE
ncbi:Crp/Fnr family transcriptional regulator [bacterium]|nr:Crp/Fnr family transcriptional regulator [bacterium]